MTKPTIESTKDQLAGDFGNVVADIEALLKATAHQGGEELAEIRAKAEESLGHVRARWSQEQAELLAKTREAAKVTDTYVHQNPWAAIGVAAGIGLMLGLFGRRL